MVVEREDYYDLTGPFQSLTIPATMHDTSCPLRQD